MTTQTNLYAVEGPNAWPLDKLFPAPSCPVDRFLSQINALMAADDMGVQQDLEPNVIQSFCVSADANDAWTSLASLGSPAPGSESIGRRNESTEGMLTTDELRELQDDLLKWGDGAGCGPEEQAAAMAAASTANAAVSMLEAGAAPQDDIPMADAVTGASAGAVSLQSAVDTMGARVRFVCDLDMIREDVNDKGITQVQDNAVRLKMRSVEFVFTFLDVVDWSLVCGQACLMTLPTPRFGVSEHLSRSMVLHARLQCNGVSKNLRVRRDIIEN
jgi:hypothetical protein